ncbi:TPA: restriction endonuclease subunit S [Pseudomonas aeruginosa]|nr:restriction endonuclease subunit S [Pseudomonas aeruginosa]
MSWPLVAIGDVAEILSGNAWKSSQFTNESEGRLPIIRIQNISDVATDFIYWDGVTLEKYIIKDGDLLLSLSGNVKLCEWSFGNALLNQRIVKLAPTACVDKRYFYWALHRVVAEIEAMARHAVIANVSVTDLKEFQIPLPPLPEQKRIAAILDKADAIRRKRQQAIQLADDFLRAVFLDMFGDPVTNPKGWDVKPLSAGIRSISSGWSASGENRPCSDGEKGVLKISAVTSGVFKPEENKTVPLDQIPEGKKLLFPKRGDLLFSRANTRELVAASCIVMTDVEDVFLPDKLWLVETDQKKLLPEFLNYLLWQPRFKERLTSQATGTSGSMLNISKSKFEETDAFFPNMELQEKFKRIYWALQETLDASASSREAGDSLFESLSQKAFSGQL